MLEITTLSERTILFQTTTRSARGISVCFENRFGFGAFILPSSDLVSKQLNSGAGFARTTKKVGKMPTSQIPVPEEGLEPSRIAAYDFESYVYTNFTTPAYFIV